MANDRAVAQVERLVVDEQANDLAVRDVDDRLAVLRVAVAGLGVRERARLVEPVQVGARDAVRLALVEVRAHADVAVGEREQRLAAAQHRLIPALLAQRPGRPAVDGFVGEAVQRRGVHARRS